MSRAKLKIKKGDQVVVISGANKGAKGEVITINVEDARVKVRGVNMKTHYNKPTQEGPGGMEKKEGFLHISNVALVDPKEGKATRVGYKTLDNGSKTRVARRSGETIN